MRIRQELLERDSRDDFKRELGARVDACSAIIHVRANEVQRAVITTRRIALSEGSNYREWDISRGTVSYSVSDAANNLLMGDGKANFAEALRDVLMASETDDPDAVNYVCFVDPSAFWTMPMSIQLLRIAAHVLPQTSTRLVLVTADTPPPQQLADIMSSVTFHSPGFKELSQSATALVERISEVEFNGMDEDGMRRLCFAAAGMSLNAFEDAVSLAVSSNFVEDEDAMEFDTIIRDVSKSKTDIIKQSDILELYPAESMDTVGGMENLKEWVNQRKECYSDEAVEFGIEPPKGMVFVGPPGTGKSLTAKAVSSVFGVPLVRLDFGRVFNSLVGSSEERMRKALQACEDMAPIVLFADEIDKGLGGMGGGGDSGTSSRVLGTFLTWLNDCKAPVFTMVTANNISGLPPELMRRGRFDAIFASGLPNSNERLEVLRIHLAKRGWDPDTFGKRDLNLVVEAAKGYVHAEVEAAVKDGLVLAFSRDKKFTADHMIEALKAMTPLSKAYEEQIQIMTAWAKANATSASREYIADDSKVTSMSERTPRRNRNKDKGEK